VRKITAVEQSPAKKPKDPVRQAIGATIAVRRWRGPDGKLPYERVNDLLRALPTDRFIMLDREQIAADANVTLATVHKFVQKAVREGWLEPKRVDKDVLGRRIQTSRFRRIPDALPSSSTQEVA
jgi:hypothetical protein